MGLVGLGDHIVDTTIVHWGSFGYVLGYCNRDTTPIMEDQMTKSMDN